MAIAKKEPYKTITCRIDDDSRKWIHEQMTVTGQSFRYIINELVKEGIAKVENEAAEGN
jgi:predicted transcriptional regulator